MSWLETHIVVPAVNPCWQCGRDTSFVHADFQAFLHPGECTAKAWAEYDEANREVERRYPRTIVGDWP